MPPAPLPLLERVSNSFSQLTNVAADLNAVSDELGKSVSLIDDAIKKLNLGITVWVRITTWDHGYRGESFTAEDLGYAKVNGKWGISLRTLEGDYQDPDEAEEEVWLFGEAPRALRLTAIDKLPELLENLSKEAVKAAAQIKAKLANVKEIAAAMSPKLIKDQMAKPENRTLLDIAAREMLIQAEKADAAIMETKRAFKVVDK